MPRCSKNYARHTTPSAARTMWRHRLTRSGQWLASATTFFAGGLTQSVRRTVLNVCLYASHGSRRSLPHEPECIGDLGQQGNILVTCALPLLRADDESELPKVIVPATPWVVCRQLCGRVPPPSVAPPPDRGGSAHACAILV